MKLQSINKTVLAATCLFCALSGAAQPVDLPAARAVGQTRLKVWGFQIYDAKLWVESGFKPDDYSSSGFALEINYLRDFDNDAVADRSLKEMRRLGPINAAQASSWLIEMRKIFPDIRKGDTLVGVHKPEQGARFTFNGKPAGEIRDKEFARLFFGIWLSPQTSEPQMRRELLQNLQSPSS